MSTRHPRVTFQSLNLPTTPKRVEILEQRLDAERRVYRESPTDSYNERIARSNIEDLEGWLVQAERNEVARGKLAAEREAKQQAEQARVDERKQQEAADLKESLRRRYLMLPGTSESDFEKDYPDLLADHRRKQMGEQDALIAETKRRIGRI